MSIDADALSKALGGEGKLRPARHLCRAELDRFSDEAAKTDNILVACTQEAPLFLDALEELGDAAPEAGFLNIREKAGWSEASRNGDKNVTAKMAALIKEASLDLKETTSVTMISTGIVLVLGKGDEAIEAARKLADRMDVTVVLEGAADASPPDVMDMPLFAGTIKSASGHLGKFEIQVENFRPTAPSSKESKSESATTTSTSTTFASWPVYPSSALRSWPPSEGSIEPRPRWLWRGLKRPLLSGGRSSVSRPLRLWLTKNECSSIVIMRSAIGN